MKSRSKSLSAIGDQEFDLVVIGGGIVGAGIAQDASSRGLSVCLIEKDDFASGTSSKTTKLIHGGLRYLEQLHFGLTRELCKERALLEHLAPHLVKDFSFILPVLKGNAFFGFKAMLGLSLYDFLSVHGSRHHRKLSKKAVLESAPALSNELVSSGLIFHDCITDDARIVLEVIKSACDFGAHCLNYISCEGFVKEGAKLKAVRCKDRLSGQEMDIRAKSFVNATGVWSDHIYGMLDQNWSSHVLPAKGIHIVLPLSSMEVNHALFLPTPDGRYLFVVPWLKALMIGTTDTFYSGDIDNPLPEGEEIDYLISCVNHFLGENKISRNDIIGSFAGLRPLVNAHSDESQSSKLSREHEIIEGPYGVLGLLGGKLTNYRLMAAQVVDRLLKHIPDHKRFRASQTEGTMLGGFVDSKEYLTSSAIIASSARKLGLTPATIEHLLANYGREAEVVLEIVRNFPELADRICPDFPPIFAEIPYIVEHEMAVSLQDVLMRRLRLGILHHRQCLDAADRVAHLMARGLGWDESRTAMEVASLESELKGYMDVIGLEPSHIGVG